ncbi:MAG: 4-hydroxythreonine-4-phosphate dehydrogenase PdxA [Kiloniellaceae bacterium]
MKPKIALVQGDATGIGPELMAKLLAGDDVREAADILVISDRQVFEAGCAVAGQEIDCRPIADIAEADWSKGEVNFLEVADEALRELTLGKVDERAGAAVLNCFGAALDLCKDGETDGLCFMPFNKQALHLAGLGEEDETQWARARIGYRGRVSEFNVIDGMWNGRVTSHVPLKEVAERLSQEEIVASVQLADQTLKEAGIARPRIAVAALNPHAGDGGKIGREEIEIIAPSVARAQALQIACEGPFPSDTLYIKVRDGAYDCAVSMYHDQGQIAIKLLGFDRGVSVLSGLPFPMTTPAHGTAFDIAGQNRANVEPARRAFLMCARMASSRRERAAAKIAG